MFKDPTNSGFLEMRAALTILLTFVALGAFFFDPVWAIVGIAVGGRIALGVRGISPLNRQSFGTMFFACFLIAIVWTFLSRATCIACQPDLLLVNATIAFGISFISGFVAFLLNREVNEPHTNAL